MGKWREILEDFPPSSFLSISLCHACRQEEEEEEPLLRAVNYYPPLPSPWSDISPLSQPTDCRRRRRRSKWLREHKRRKKRGRGGKGDVLNLKKKTGNRSLFSEIILPSRLFFWQKKPCVPLTLAPPSILFGWRKGGQEGKEVGGNYCSNYYPSFVAFLGLFCSHFLPGFFPRHPW